MTTKIPYDFLCQRVNLSWHDIQFGIEHQLISPQVAIDKAMNRLNESGDTSPDVVELASHSEADPVLELVRRLSASESATSHDVQTKWLYLILAWLFENQTSVKDPLGIVEEVYTDFGYPREIASFVRYMPMVGPDLGSREQNEARLYARWENYLDEARKRFHQT